ncbi:MAG TPA: acyl-CoA dehydrogenase family protein [Candidatus Polarisedimenticolia bacterium]|nr:acyl-CoA dehydrogenase family protein [Candidatus Polarisedimenticolia bacterium]
MATPMPDIKNKTRAAAVPGSFMKSLFSGRLEAGLIFPYPRQDEESRETLRLVLESFRSWARERLDGGAIDRAAVFPEAQVRELKELGLLGLTIPEEYGGAGLSLTSYCRLMEEICHYCATTCTIVGAHLGIGSKGLLLYGSEAQKKRWLPAVAKGDLLAAYALTEPDSGSDAASLKTRAVWDEKRQIWLMNGGKRFITNGGKAGLFTVFARTEVGGRDTISAFVVTRDLPGVSTGKEEDKLGLKGSSTTDLYLANVPVPKENLLGEAGRGFKYAMEILNDGRVSLAAGAVGGSKEMIDRAVDYARQRRQFGRPIAEFEMIRDKIASMMTGTYAAESMVYLTTGLAERGDVDYSIESALSKIFSSENAWRVVNHAVQIAGGNGFIKEYPYERYLRDCRINMIFEGTNEILRAFVTLAGVQRLGEELKRVGRALSDPISQIGVLSDFALKKIRQAITDEQFPDIDPLLKKTAVRAAHYAEALSTTAEAALREHGKGIVEREFIQERLAESAGDLYALIACLSRANTRIREQGADKAKRDILLTRTFGNAAWRRIRRRLHQVGHNQDANLARVSDLAYEQGGYGDDLIS